MCPDDDRHMTLRILVGEERVQVKPSYSVICGWLLGVLLVVLGAWFALLSWRAIFWTQQSSGRLVGTSMYCLGLLGLIVGAVDLGRASRRLGGDDHSVVRALATVVAGVVLLFVPFLFL